jgi:hypothetical protein
MRPPAWPTPAPSTARCRMRRACSWPTAACWPRTRWSGCRPWPSRAPIIALGLNYADHVKELSKELTTTAKDEPLVFLKGPGSLIGHRGRHRSARPTPASCTTSASWRWSSAAPRAA